MPEAWDQRCDLLQLALEVWRYGVSEAKWLKELENVKLKRLLAESVMDVWTLREMLGEDF